MTHIFDMTSLDPETIARLVALYDLTTTEEYLLDHLDRIDFRDVPAHAQWARQRAQEQAHGSQNQQHRYP